MHSHSPVKSRWLVQAREEWLCKGEVHVSFRPLEYRCLLGRHRQGMLAHDRHRIMHTPAQHHIDAKRMDDMPWMCLLPATASPNSHRLLNNCDGFHRNVTSCTFPTASWCTKARSGDTRTSTAGRRGLKRTLRRRLYRNLHWAVPAGPPRAAYDCHSSAECDTPAKRMRVLACYVLCEYCVWMDALCGLPRVTHAPTQ
jgi:hypothetical protein